MSDLAMHVQGQHIRELEQKLQSRDREIDKLKNIIEELHEVVKFYADMANYSDEWVDWNCVSITVDDVYGHAGFRTGGKLAMQTLKDLGEIC
jgi:hypothetical protein